MVQSYTKGVEYTDQDEHVLEFVAQHIAVALTRARALEETRQRNYELQIINSVQAALAAHLDIHGIYEAVGVKLREIFNYQDGAIYSADLKARAMTIEYGFEKGRKIEQFTMPMNSLYEFIVAGDKYLVFNGDFPQFAAQYKDYQVPVGELPKSAFSSSPYRKAYNLLILPLLGCYTRNHLPINQYSLLPQIQLLACCFTQEGGSGNGQSKNRFRRGICIFVWAGLERADICPIHDGQPERD